MSSCKIHYIKGHIQNIFVAEYTDKILLLDGGCRSDAKIIEEFITKTINRQMSDIKLIVVTHNHTDHAGGAQILRKKFNIPIAAYYNIDKWYEGFSGKIQHFVDFIFSWRVVIKSKKAHKRMWHNRFVKPNFRLFNKNVLPFFYEWEVIHTPGHTSHDISLYQQPSKILYIGDVVVQFNEKFHLPFPLHFPVEIKKSLEKLSKLEIKKILFAHGTDLISDNYKIFFDTMSNRAFDETTQKFKFYNNFTKLGKTMKNYKE